MRPRVFPAEDQSTGSHVVQHLEASMRPRVFPAEDEQPLHPALWVYECFNEAAGIPRGRLAAPPV